MSGAGSPFWVRGWEPAQRERGAAQEPASGRCKQVGAPQNMCCSTTRECAVIERGVAGSRLGSNPQE
eukprot:6456903-Alexandrium_andersonii.AAC.1